MSMDLLGNLFVSLSPFCTPQDEVGRTMDFQIVIGLQANCKQRAEERRGAYSMANNAFASNDDSNHYYGIEHDVSMQAFQSVTSRTVVPMTDEPSTVRRNTAGNQELATRLFVAMVILSSRLSSHFHA